MRRLLKNLLVLYRNQNLETDNAETWEYADAHMYFHEDRECMNCLFDSHREYDYWNWDK